MTFAVRTGCAACRLPGAASTRPGGGTLAERTRRAAVEGGIAAALAVCIIGVAPAAAARPAAVQAPAPCVLPDLARMHPAVQAQLEAARERLAALESAAGDGDDPGRRQARGDAHGALGTLLLAGDYPEAAAACYRRARTLAPADARWPYYLAHVALRRGDAEAAARWLEQVLRLDPADFAAPVWLLHVYVDLDRLEAAEPLLAAALVRHPAAAALLYQGGRASAAARDWPRAVERFEAALAADPSATVIHYPLAMAWRGLGDLDRAREHLGRGGSRSGAGYAAGAAVPMADPRMAAVNGALRSPQTHRDLGLQASAREDWPAAVREFRAAVGMAPDNAVLRLNLGTALAAAGAARDALAAFEAALGIDPRLATAHYRIGVLLERAGRDADAIARFEAALAADGALTAVRLRLADALRRTGRFEAALAHYARIPDGDEARFGEVMALVRLGRHAEAAVRLDALRSGRPQQPAFAHALARVLAAAPDDAVRDGPRALALVQALAVEHRTASVAETMAMALAAVGRFAEAVEWQRFAMAIVSDAGRADVAGALAGNLTRYLRGEPSRTPWRDDDPEHNPGPVVEPGLLDASRP